MKFCPKCGNPLDHENIKFCPKCGNPLIDEEITDQVVNTNSNTNQGKKKNKSIKYLLLALVLVIACGGGYFAYTKYQESDKEKDRIAEQEENKKQVEKEYAEQKEKELEEKDKEIKDSLASKSNINDTLIFSMYDKYQECSDIIGMNNKVAKEQYNMSGISEINVNEDGIIKSFSIFFDEPLYSETLLSASDSYPFMTPNKEKGFFTETGIISRTGEKIQIFYYVDQATLSIDRAVIVGVKQCQRSLEMNGGEISDCLRYDPKDDITHFAGGYAISGNHCY